MKYLSHASFHKVQNRYNHSIIEITNLHRNLICDLDLNLILQVFVVELLRHYIWCISVLFCKRKGFQKKDLHVVSCVSKLR